MFSTGRRVPGATSARVAAIWGFAIGALVFASFLLSAHNQLAAQRVALAAADRELAIARARDLGDFALGPRLDAPVPIFVIHRDRHTHLREFIASLRAVLEPASFEIVVHDMGSSNPDTLAALAALAREPAVSIVRDDQVDAAMAAAVQADMPYNDRVSLVLNRVASTVRGWMARSRSRVYVVTDPDLRLARETPRDALRFFARLLELLPYATVVGPALRLDTLPESLCRSVYIQQHETTLWARFAHSVTLDHIRRYFTYPVLIDTTFGMYRASFEFTRLNGGVRTHAPYWAEHVSWTVPLSPDAWDPEHRYYVEHALPITAWTVEMQQELAGNDWNEADGRPPTDRQAATKSEREYDAKYRRYLSEKGITCG